MTKKNSFFKKGDIRELREWTRLILMNEKTQRQIESGEMTPEWKKMFITGRAGHEANIFIAKQIVKALKAKITTWEKLIESIPKDESVKA